jgi:ribosomal protein S18 acetylase RimI-like enzyme
MTDFRNLVIAPLNPTHDTHDRTGFQCGVEALDRYFKKQAKQDIKRRISRVFVATEPDDPKAVIGYYTLSTLSIELNQLPAKLARKLPKHPVPAALIGRLAVSNAAQGQGVGKMLLADAIKRTMAVSDQIAIYAMVVDATNENAIGFYEQFGFQRLSDDSLRLFLPLKSII